MSKLFKPLKYHVKGHKVIDLVEIQLQRVRETFSSLVESLVSTCHVLQVYEPLGAQVVNVTVCCRLLVDTGDLVNVAGLHEEKRQLLNSDHLQLEDIVEISVHGKEGEPNREKQSYCIVLFELDFVGFDNHLVSKVSLTHKDSQVFKEAFGTSVLPSLVPQTHKHQLLHHH